jgi:L-gulono-1,4-lactone dehydrogenase
MSRAARTFGLFFVFAGAMHFVIPRTYQAIVPDRLPAKRAIVYASGVAEVLGGLGVMHARTRRLASWWSVATLVAVFPANVHMALHADRYRVPGGRAALLARLPLQALAIRLGAGRGAVSAGAAVAVPTWRNWAGDQACTPAAIEHPASAAEVAEAIRRAREARRVVRVAGAGHSFTPAVLTDGTLIRLDRMRRVLDVDRDSGLVRVEAGISLRELSEAMHGHGLAFENLGDVDVQSIAGATATGTHGTGARLRNLSSALHEVELVTADGETVSLSEASDPDGWRAARVSVGALGVVTAVTLRAVPAFTLEGVDTTTPLEGVLGRLDELAEGNDHFELYAFPYTSLALTRTNNRVDEPPAPPSRARGWVDDVLLRNAVFGLACRVGRRSHRLIPHLNRLLARASGTTRRVDRSDRIFASPRLVRFTEMEYAIPRARLAEAVRAVLGCVEERGFAVPFPIEVRFVAPDDAFLSPAGGRETGYVAVHMYRGMEWEPYFRAVEEIMDCLDGRPHWGKRHFQTAETLAPRYPDWERFQAVRRRLDPDGVLVNDYLRRVLVGEP